MSSKEKVKVKGRVSEVSGSGIKVEIDRPGECGDCSLCAGPGGNVITLPNRPGFQEGENVFVVIPCSAFSGISFLIYFIPSLFLLAGFVWGYLAGGNLTAVAGGIAGLVISYGAVKIITGKRYKKYIEITHNYSYEQG
ncbi:MAG: SoxR reducing system RseC family protein [Elusimicrobiota bacterium]|nr:SoxR reducing system RseC family protein [Elusimicrobiota bacterium]